MRVCAVLSLLFAYAACAHACPVETLVSCTDVYAALVSRVKCVSSDCPETISSAVCMQNKLMQRVLT